MKLQPFLVRMVMIYLAAIPTTVFWDSIIAYNFNLPTFSYFEIVLGLISGYMVKAALFHKIEN